MKFSLPSLNVRTGLIAVFISPSKVTAMLRPGLLALDVSTSSITSSPVLTIVLATTSVTIGAVTKDSKPRPVLSEDKPPSASIVLKTNSALSELRLLKAIRAAGISSGSTPIYPATRLARPVRS